MFSVLGDREIGGRTGTILEGESGANDPVGIALMIGMIELATHADASFWIVVRVFVEQMSIGLAIGDRRRARSRRGCCAASSLPSSGLYTVRTLALAGVVYGVAAVAHGSGFLAVFVAGLIVGDVEAPFKREIEVFQDGARDARRDRRVRRARPDDRHLGASAPGAGSRGSRSRRSLALVARPLVVGALLAARAACARASGCSSCGAG